MPESRFANGNIHPGRFVKLDSSTAGGKVLECAGTTVPIFGIAQMATRNAPYPLLDDGYAAIASEDLLVYTFSDKEVWLEIGSGGCNPGDRLTSDGTGAGIATTSTGNWVGAVAKQQGAQGDLVPVDVVPSYQY